MMVDQAGTFPKILTERLRLRRFEPKDDAGLHACIGDANLVRYWDFSACKNIQETRSWVRVLAKTTSPNESIAWAVAEKDSDNCIGMVNYHHREPLNRRLEIGYILRSEWHGRGLMSEGVQAVMSHCLGKLNTHRIAAVIHPDNAPSIRLVTRLGFACEGGPLRDYWRVGNNYMSPMLYSFIAN
ncbi:ribosomal-protein-alanine N-acetyltransferase [Phyllobacterium trifolii]|jgi:ribosomal-protein-alanine N-acetyltransferase|uniref:Ribosomal-protein-alanine N-acetyltransferase n=1 Tax=Phyllobacterium trifolii TaxID=300193 RepID=A0A839U0D6_9HYPH|nr:GNAT family N-acetyltransferase [Phyllobacterium trifolii]MBB3144048.1 ribosomal-protein-alanine N-acetyltransferase [Phyllobacterium trifolii]